MKKIPMLLAVCAVAMSSCGEGKPGGDTEKAIVVGDSSVLSQTLGFDATSGSAVTFTASGAWTSTVSQTRSAAAEEVKWIEVAPDHGDAAGEYEMGITLLPNDTGADRTAEIKIFCEGDVVTVSVTQRREGAPSEGRITVAEGTKLTQSVAAESTHGETPIKFTTDGAWSAAVLEVFDPAGTPSAEVMDGEAWISISPDHGDAAGEYEMEIRLQPNDTGADRSAVITIECGDAKVEARITQKKANGGAGPASGLLKNVTKFYEEGGQKYKTSMDFKYDGNSRLIEMDSFGINVSTGEREGAGTVSVSYGEGTVTMRTESEWEGDYGDIDPAPAARVGGRMTVEIIASLDADGYMESAELVTVYYNSRADGTEEEWDRDRIEYTAHYTDGFLDAASWKMYNADGVLTDSNESLCRWTEGNMTEVERRYTHYDAQGVASYTDETVAVAEYATMLDNSGGNLDLNWIIMDSRTFGEIDNSGVMAIMGLYGNRSSNRLSHTYGKESNPMEKDMRYSYKFDAEGYVTEITCTEEVINILDKYIVSYY